MTFLRFRATLVWGLFLSMAGAALTGRFAAPAWLQCVTMVLVFMAALFCEVSAK